MPNIFKLMKRCLGGSTNLSLFPPSMPLLHIQAGQICIHVNFYPRTALLMCTGGNDRAVAAQAEFVNFAEERVPAVCPLPCRHHCSAQPAAHDNSSSTAAASSCICDRLRSRQAMQLRNRTPWLSNKFSHPPFLFHFGFTSKEQRREKKYRDY